MSDDILNYVDPERLPPELRQIWDRWRHEEEEIRKQFIREHLEMQREQKYRQDARRNADFSDAKFKVSRAGYVGKHGSFPVNEEKKWEMESWRHQAEHGDYDINKDSGDVQIKVVELWKSHKGTNEKEAKRTYIRLANDLIMEHGWNPPAGWQ